MKNEVSIRALLSQPGTRNLRVVILVHDVDSATAATVDYALSLRPEHVSGVHVAFSGARARQVANSWNARFGPLVPLLVVEAVNGQLSDSLGPVVNSELPDTDHPLVILVPQRGRLAAMFRRRKRDPKRLAHAFEGVPGVWTVWISAS